MSYILGENRGQLALLLAAVEDYVAADAPVRVIDAFVNGLDAKGLGFGPCGASSGGSASVRSARSREGLSIRLPQRGTLVAPAGARVLSQPRGDVASAPLGARLQNDSGLSPRQRFDNRRRMSGVCAVLPGSGIIYGAAGGT
jgi:hypothetical protein